MWVLYVPIFLDSWRHWRRWTFYINMNLTRTILLETGVERLRQWEFETYQFSSSTVGEIGDERFYTIWILCIQIYWRLGLLNVYVNVNSIRTNFLRQLERLEINVLYQYESYTYKFYWRLGLKIYVNVNFILILNFSDFKGVFI